MNEQTLKEKKLDLYVILKIIKYCTGSSARSYQCKYAVNDAFMNKEIRSVDMGAAIKKVIHFKTIRGKFSSVHPDLAAEGITRVEVGEEGLHFIKDREPSELFSPVQRHSHLNFQFSDARDHGQHNDVASSLNEDEDEMLARAIAMSLEEQPRFQEEEESEEEMLARALSMVELELD